MDDRGCVKVFRPLSGKEGEVKQAERRGESGIDTFCASDTSLSQRKGGRGRSREEVKIKSRERGGDLGVDVPELKCGKQGCVLCVTFVAPVISSQEAMLLLLRSTA